MTMLSVIYFFWSSLWSLVHSLVKSFPFILGRMTKQITTQPHTIVIREQEWAWIKRNRFKQQLLSICKIRWIKPNQVRQWQNRATNQKKSSGVKSLTNQQHDMNNCTVTVELMERWRSPEIQSSTYVLSLSLSTILYSFMKYNYSKLQHGLMCMQFVWFDVVKLKWYAFSWVGLPHHSEFHITLTHCSCSFMLSLSRRSLAVGLLHCHLC